ncbi:MAG TPA: hypothetical protein VIU63_01945 [Nitrospira sp.]
MTFGYEVRCKDTWGHVLEGLLQPQVQILNFGVSAYGLNQVFLRYEKEVRSWKPDIVLVGISSEMIRRINSIYPFLMNPEWGTFLFNRPRLVNKNGVLSTINAPVPSAKDVASFLTIQELPHLDLDDYYRPVEWERGGMWTLLEQSYIFRFANSLRPPANRIGEDDILRGAMESSRQVLTSLLDEITRDGAIPIVVYFPYAVELAAGNPDATDLPLSLKTLRTAGIEYHDVSGCLQKVRTASAYMGGGHYSPEGHLGIAQCLEPVVREVMQRSKEKNPVPERT